MRRYVLVRLLGKILRENMPPIYRMPLVYVPKVFDYWYDIRSGLKVCYKNCTSSYSVLLMTNCGRVGMHTYNWLDSYDLGIEVIDLQHKNLLAMINKLLVNQNESRGIMQRLINEVIAYAEYHFISEENLMVLSRYDGYEKHTNVHNMLLKQLKNQCSQFINNHCELKTVILFMANWLIEHIMAEENDRDFAKYLLASNEYRYLIKI